MGSNFPKSSYPNDGGIDSHPFAGFGGVRLSQRLHLCVCERCIGHASDCVTVVANQR
jgi:hypothetical protein